MRFFATLLAALPLAAAAQNTGEMWEITSQMNIPGMPAGHITTRVGGLMASEDNFAIRMRPIDLVPENLASVRQIAHVVVRRLAARH